MDKIRQIFAVKNNVPPSLFSYNSDGACENCKGIGTIELNMSFMDNITIICSVCEGKRYKKEVLEYKYNRVNIVDIMDMTVNEALVFCNP